MMLQKFNVFFDAEHNFQICLDNDLIVADVMCSAVYWTVIGAEIYVTTYLHRILMYIIIIVDVLPAQRVNM